MALLYWPLWSGPAPSLERCQMERLKIPETGSPPLNADLSQVMHHVAHIVFRLELQRNRLVVPDYADHTQFIRRQAGDNMREIAIVTGPQSHQKGPVRRGRILHLHAASLVVSRESQRIGERRTHES